MLWGGGGIVGLDRKKVEEDGGGWRRMKKDGGEWIKAKRY